MEPPNLQLETRLSRLRPMLVSLAEALISPANRNDIEASDLVQQTLLEAHIQSQSLQTLAEGPLFGWLRTALRNNVLDAVKHMYTQKNDVRKRLRIADIADSFVRLEQLLATDETSPSEVIQRKEQTALLLEAIQQLPDNQKQAIILKHLRGFSLKQTAESLGLSEAATAGLLHRGRKQLAEQLEQRSYDS